VKYYIYISDSKLDMLWPQLPEASKRRITRELKLDWKVISLSRKSEELPTEHRIHRLEAVERYLMTEESEKVGSLDSPKPWILDTLNLKSGVYRKWRRPDKAAIFAGADDHHVVLLGGSVHHLTGYGRTDANRAPGDYFGSELGQLMRVLVADHSESMTTSDLYSRNIIESIAIGEAIRAMLHWNSPTQPLQFLAKSFFPSPRQLNYNGLLLDVTFATPLYVAMAD
jgi:hypothetical protein